MGFFLWKDDIDYLFMYKVEYLNFYIMFLFIDYIKLVGLSFDYVVFVLDFNIIIEKLIFNFDDEFMSFSKMKYKR